MGCVLHECLGDYVPPSPRCSSPPCSRSSLPKGCGNPSAEEGDSRESVEQTATDAKDFKLNESPGIGLT
jgi:hypothetical protein